MPVGDQIEDCAVCAQLAAQIGICLQVPTATLFPPESLGNESVMALVIHNAIAIREDLAGM